MVDQLQRAVELLAPQGADVLYGRGRGRNSLGTGRRDVDVDVNVDELSRHGVDADVVVVAGRERGGFRGRGHHFDVGVGAEVGRIEGGVVRRDGDAAGGVPGRGLVALSGCCDWYQLTLTR